MPGSFLPSPLSSCFKLHGCYGMDIGGYKGFILDVEIKKGKKARRIFAAKGITGEMFSGIFSKTVGVQVREYVYTPEGHFTVYVVSEK